MLNTGAVLTASATSGTFIKLAGYHFTRCKVTGCFIERVIDAQALEPFRIGQAGILALIDRTGQPMAMPLSFVGFTKALETTSERNRQWAGET